MDTTSVGGRQLRVERVGEVSPVLVKTRPRTSLDRLLRAQRREYPEVQVLRLILAKRRCPFWVKSVGSSTRLQTSGLPL